MGLELFCFLINKHKFKNQDMIILYIEELKRKLTSDYVFSLTGAERLNFKFNFRSVNLGM